MTSLIPQLQTSITPKEQRTAAIEAAITSESYQSAPKDLRSSSYPVSCSEVRLEQDIIATVNLLGFCILCGFPLQPTAISPNINGSYNFASAEMLYLVKKLLQWINYYDVLEATRWKLAHMFMSAPWLEYLPTSDYQLIRIASILRDEELFSHALNRNPFFSKERSFHLEALDIRLGLPQWIF